MAKKGQKIRPRPEGYLLAIIADEVERGLGFFVDPAKDTCTGFMLAGTGCVDANRKANFLVVDPKTTKAQIKQAFEEFTTREDIGVLLISQEVADDIRFLLDEYDQVRPAILEIPSKGRPYNAEKDSMMQRIKRLISHE